MQSLSTLKEFLPGILFFLLAAFAPMLPCVAVTIVEIYNDDAGEGFLDKTELTEAQKAFLSGRENDAETYGEARKNAFEHASSILESRLTNTNTIRVSAKFEIFDGQEDPNDKTMCRQDLSGPQTVAFAGPKYYFYPRDRLDAQPDQVGSGTAYPYALAEAIWRQNLNDQEADIAVKFSKCIPFYLFYYGITGSTPEKRIDFVQLSMHEIIHGLGFIEHLQQDGSYRQRTISFQGQEYEIISRTIYDEQLYSDTHDDLVVNLTNSRRAAAATSGTGLLWDGTDGGENSCSYGQRMAELKSSSAKASDGKPRLHAPSTYNKGGSILHTHEKTEDIMEAFVLAPKNMDLTLGMLKDMGWSVSADGFPPDCEPTGMTAVPTSGLVTTEGGGTAKFEVKLESEPLEDVVISVESDNPAEGIVTDPQTLELTFTPRNWDMEQEVTVTGVDDALQDGPQNYFVELKADSKDRFYAVLESTLVYLRNEDNDFSGLIIEDSAAEEGDSLDFTVTLSPQNTQMVTVEYAITDGTAQEGSDYTASPSSGTLMFTPGETQKTISVHSIDDSINEPDEETLVVTLRNPQNAVLNRNRATGIIKDNDDPDVSVQFASSAYSAAEGETVAVRVTLSGDPERTVTIPITVDQATTATTEDYSLSSTSVTFASGETSKDITLTATDDDVDDDDEVVVLDFETLPPRVSVGTHASSTITIRDNDDPDVSVQFASSAYSVTEGETVAVRVTLSEDPERTVTIPITVDQATTATTEDYSLSSTSVTFASGETSKDITLTATDDDVDDDDESVELGFGTLPEGVSAGGGDRTTITILDNDVPGGGGGGCAIAAETNHGVAAVNLLLIITVLFSVLFRKSRLANQSRYGRSH